MKDLINKMKTIAKQEYNKQDLKYNDGTCEGVNTDVAFNFKNKKYIIEMMCYWSRTYYYKLNDNGKIISDGFMFIRQHFVYGIVSSSKTGVMKKRNENIISFICSNWNSIRFERFKN